MSYQIIQRVCVVNNSIVTISKEESVDFTLGAFSPALADRGLRRQRPLNYAAPVMRVGRPFAPQITDGHARILAYRRLKRIFFAKELFKVNTDCRLNATNTWRG